MDLNKRTMTKLALLVGGGILLNWLLGNFAVVGDFGGFIWNMLFPFIIGFIIAFVLNIPMSAIEKHVFRGRGGRLKRPISFLLAVIVVLALLALVIFIVIPGLVDTLWTLAGAMPSYIQGLQKALEPYADYVPQLEEFLQSLNIDWQNLASELISFVQGGLINVFSSAYSVATSIVWVVTSSFIGIVFACYLLFDKEHLSAQLQALLKAYLPKRTFRRVTYVGSLSYRSYAGFVAGQCTEALILTAMYLLTLSIGGFDYWLLISVFTGFTSLIPMIGAFIGCFVGVLLLLVSQGFWRALAFVIVFLVVQTIEGNLIYPHVVGKSVGLPAVWTLVAVMVGGSIAGIFGMIFFIPLFSILYTLLHRAARARLLRRGLTSPTAELRARTGTGKNAKHHFFKWDRKNKAKQKTGKSPGEDAPPKDG